MAYVYGIPNGKLEILWPDEMEGWSTDAYSTLAPVCLLGRVSIATLLYIR